MTKQAHHRTASKMIALCNCSVLPITAEKVKRLGAALTYGKCRAAKQYLPSLKLLVVREGFDISAPIVQAISDAGIYCIRGLGAAKQAKGLLMPKVGRASRS